MNKDTKRVLILGNGFDLCLGRKTSYKDFCESKFCPKDYPSPLIKHLNDKWSDNLDAIKWYDLENELYNYYTDIKNNNGQTVDLYNDTEKQIVEIVHNYQGIPSENTFIRDNIQLINRLIVDNALINNGDSNFGYIYGHEDILSSPIERDKKSLKLVKEGLMQYLTKVQREPINEKSIAAIIARTFIHNNSNNQVIIYSFNYTDFGEIVPKSSFVMKLNDLVTYVHGCCLDENIILGTKDENIDQNYDFIQKSFDSQYNPPAMVYDLMDADDITIFGHSLGMNDSQYFKAFFERQSSTSNPKKKNITIFTKDTKSEIEIKRSLQEMTNWNLTSLYGLNNLQIIKTDECINNPAQLKRYIRLFVDSDEDVEKIIHN